MNKERVLNIAKALRESPNPDRFAMYDYGSCSTPMCAFGHYAHRTDLQSEFKMSEYGPVTVDDECIDHLDPQVLEHFDFASEEEANQFFGCHIAAREAKKRGHAGPFLVDEATSASAAADWIERFVAKH
jgi:hypothetical protein